MVQDFVHQQYHRNRSLVGFAICLKIVVVAVTIGTFHTLRKEIVEVMPTNERCWSYHASGIVIFSMINMNLYDA